MKQFFALAAVTVAATVGTLSAGTVYTQIGDGTNGLTQAYIQNGLPGSATNPNLIQGSLVNTNPTGQQGFTPSAFYGKSYDGRLFQSATPAQTPYAGYNLYQSQTGSLPGTIDSNPLFSAVTFQMIQDGCTDSAVPNSSALDPTLGTCTGGGSGPNNSANNNSLTNQSANVWMATSAGTLTIPIGIFDATNVYTMLDNLWGIAGAMDTQISFTFGNSSNDTSNDTKTLTLNLTNASNNSNGVGSGQIGTALECAGVGVCKDVAGLTYATGPLAPTSVVTATDGLTQVTVNTDTVYSGSYNNAVSKFNGSTGNAVLADQDFVLPFYSADPYLVSVSVTELNGGNFVSATTLSAITVQSTTPEPSTIFMVLAGVGLIAVIRFRRKTAPVQG